MNASSPNFVVAVTQRIDNVPGREETRDALDQRLIRWLGAADFVPVVVPNSLLDSGPDGLNRWLASTRPGAIVLSGGNDVGERPDRDATEGHLLSWAQAGRLPVLGICRGLQMMAAWAGAELINVRGHVRTRHNLRTSNAADEWPGDVNSYHDWGFNICPKHFEVLARAPDGTIEAMRHLTLPWEGWMWHPEREQVFSPRDIARVKELFHGR